ncbi:MAG: Fur family transcriptional regulator [Anaerolineales bacterium]|jgi:Fe2+ or Zn2+ uptake regulation protein
MPGIDWYWFDKLHKNGCRLTAPRRAVVEALAESFYALTPVEVYDEARKDCPGLGLVSVYRTLEKLEELGLVQRVHQTRGCQAFIRAGDGHQHLMICTQCGRAVLFEGDQLDPLFNALSERTGFQIENHWLQVFGLCKACRPDS